jgi:hypothetical protein
MAIKFGHRGYRDCESKIAVALGPKHSIRHLLRRPVGSL